MIVAWAIWNRIVEECYLEEVIAIALSLLKVYRMAHMKDDKQLTHAACRDTVEWSAPPMGMLKIHTSGAIFNCAGVGMGTVLRAFCAQVKRDLDETIVEAKAMILGF